MAATSGGGGESLHLGAIQGGECRERDEVALCPVPPSFWRQRRDLGPQGGPRASAQTAQSPKVSPGAAQGAVPARFTDFLLATNLVLGMSTLLTPITPP